jgi:hypothetical protein
MRSSEVTAAGRSVRCGAARIEEGLGCCGGSLCDLGGGNTHVADGIVCRVNQWLRSDGCFVRAHSKRLIFSPSAYPLHSPLLSTVVLYYSPPFVSFGDVGQDCEHRAWLAGRRGDHDQDGL